MVGCLYCGHHHAHHAKEEDGEHWVVWWYSCGVEHDSTAMVYILRDHNWAHHTKDNHDDDVEGGGDDVEDNMEDNMEDNTMGHNTKVYTNYNIPNSMDDTKGRNTMGHTNYSMGSPPLHQTPIPSNYSILWKNSI